MAIESNTRIIRTGGLMSAPIEGELVILNMTKNNYIGLDEIGRQIWEMLEKPRNVEEIYDLLSREFDAEPGQIAIDVSAFLEELKDEGLVRIVD